MKRLLWAFLLLGLVATGAAGEKKDVKIAYVGYSRTTPFWITVENEAVKRGKELGVEVVDLTPNEPDAMLQLKAIENAVLQKVGGIIIGPVSTKGLNAGIDKAKEAGIPVICVDAIIDHPWVSTTVQSDNYAEARRLGEYIAKNMKPGKFLLIGGTIGHETGESRKKGIEEMIKPTGNEIIFRSSDWLEPKAREIAENELAAHPDITTIFSAWDPGAMATRSVLKERGLTDKIQLYGFDGNPANIKAIDRGEITGTLKQDNVAFGRRSVEVLLDIINNGAKPEKVIAIPGVIVTKENAKKYLE